jgi:hypothetical protein
VFLIEFSTQYLRTGGCCLKPLSWRGYHGLCFMMKQRSEMKHAMTMVERGLMTKEQSGADEDSMAMPGWE